MEARSDPPSPRTLAMVPEVIPEVTLEKVTNVEIRIVGAWSLGLEGPIYAKIKYQDRKYRTADVDTAGTAACRWDATFSIPMWDEADVDTLLIEVCLKGNRLVGRGVIGDAKHGGARGGFAEGAWLKLRGEDGGSAAGEILLWHAKTASSSLPARGPSPSSEIGDQKGGSPISKVGDVSWSQGSDECVLIVQELLEKKAEGADVVAEILHRMNKLAFGSNLEGPLGVSECLEVIVWLMMCYRFESELQIEACALVANLSGCRRNGELLGTLDACTQVVAVMKEHCGVEDVQLWGCLALAQLSVVSGNRARLITANGAGGEGGASKAAEYAMELYPENEALKEPAEHVIIVCSVNHDLWRTPQLFECIIPHPGVGYRFNPVFADKKSDGSGPRSTSGTGKPKVMQVTGTAFKKSSEGVTFLECSSGRGWLPLSNPAGTVKCFKHLGPAPPVDYEAESTDSVDSKPTNVPNVVQMMAVAARNLHCDGECYLKIKHRGCKYRTENETVGDPDNCFATMNLQGKCIWSSTFVIPLQKHSTNQFENDSVEDLLVEVYEYRELEKNTLVGKGSLRNAVAAGDRTDSFWVQLLGGPDSTTQTGQVLVWHGPVQPEDPARADALCKLAIHSTAISNIPVQEWQVEAEVDWDQAAEEAEAKAAAAVLAEEIAEDESRPVVPLPRLELSVMMAPETVTVETAAPDVSALVHQDSMTVIYLDTDRDLLQFKLCCTGVSSPFALTLTCNGQTCHPTWKQLPWLSWDSASRKLTDPSNEASILPPDVDISWIASLASRAVPECEWRENGEVNVSKQVAAVDCEVHVEVEEVTFSDECVLIVQELLEKKAEGADVVAEILHRMNKLAFGSNLEGPLGVSECLEVVVWLMLCYRFESELQIEACALVANLSGCRRNGELLGTLDACTQVVAVMKEHCGVEDVQVGGGVALANLSVASGNRARLIKANASKAAHQALELYPENEALITPAEHVIKVCGESNADTEDANGPRPKA